MLRHPSHVNTCIDSSLSRSEKNLAWDTVLKGLMPVTNQSILAMVHNIQIYKCQSFKKLCFVVFYILKITIRFAYLKKNSDKSKTKLYTVPNNNFLVVYFFFIRFLLPMTLLVYLFTNRIFYNRYQFNISQYVLLVIGYTLYSIAKYL